MKYKIVYMKVEGGYGSKIVTFKSEPTIAQLQSKVGRYDTITGYTRVYD